MSKKTWVKVKRGLIYDPKHRDKIGEAVWLYLYILDHADFETGIAYDWKDAAAAEELDIPMATLRKQRRRLHQAKYIRCEQMQHRQRIVVTKWIDPRAYAAETINQGDHLRQPSEKSHGDRQGGRSWQPSEVHGDRHGDRHGDHPSPPSLFIHDINNHEERESAEPEKKANSTLSGNLGQGSNGKSEAVRMVKEIVGTVPIPILQERMVEEIQDLDVWRGVLTYWRDNNYGKASHGKMLDRYAEQISAADPYAELRKKHGWEKPK